MTCAATVRAVERRLARDERVAGADVLAPVESPHDRVTVEVTVLGDCAPAGVVQALAGDLDADLHHVGPQGGGYRVTATV
jgi:hypothetical protein